MKSVLKLRMNCANKFDRIGDGLIQIEVSILKSIDFSDRDLPLSSQNHEVPATNEQIALIAQLILSSSRIIYACNI